MQTSPIVDANVVLRYLLDDHPVLSAQARTLLDAGTKVFLPNEVLCEIVCVLRSVYSVSRSEASSVLLALASRPQVEFENREVVRLALETYGLKSVDIVDALLFARRRINGVEIVTFDATLRRMCQPPTA